MVLQRLGYLLGEERYLVAAERTLRAAWPAIAQHPQGHATLLQALEEYLQAPEIVILRGPMALITAWQQQLAAVYAPRRMVLAIDENAVNLPAALLAKTASPVSTLSTVH